MNTAKLHLNKIYNFKLIFSQLSLSFRPCIFGNHGRYLFSKTKFYEILQQKEEEDYINLSTQDNILSRFLKQQPKVNFMQAQNKKKSKQTLISKNKKNAVDYKSLLQNNPNGCILRQNFKSQQLLLIGLNFKNADWRNLYKSLYKFQPSAIIVQNRPELFIQQFQVLKKNKIDGVFDDMQYLNQLKIKHNLLPDQINKNMSQQKDNRTKFSQQISNSKVFPQINNEIVNKKALITSLYYGSKKETQILLGQIPQCVQREWICNTHSLMELQEIFKVVMKQMAFYSGIELSPYQLASYLFPDKFLQTNDKYVATLIQMLITLGHNKIAYFGGVSQNQAVLNILKENILEKDNFIVQPILTYLIPPKAKGNVIRDIEGYQIIEKHIILDILYHAEGVLHLPLSSFKSTNQVIQHYGKKLYNYTDQNLMKFRYDTTKKYVQLMNQKRIQGERIKKKEFMRSALRQ